MSCFLCGALPIVGVVLLVLVLLASFGLGGYVFIAYGIKKKDGWAILVGSVLTLMPLSLGVVAWCEHMEKAQQTVEARP